MSDTTNGQFIDLTERDAKNMLIDYVTIESFMERVSKTK